MSDIVDNKYDWTPLYKNEKKCESPIILEAKVVHGFKRGSKELGIPTANLNMEELGDAGNNLDTGIYYGLAKLRGEIYSTVVSVGWNPYYKNEKKTIEAHLISQLEDFYDETIRVILCGYLRDEANFKSLDELISCIKNDIRLAQDRLKDFKREDLPLN